MTYTSAVQNLSPITQQRSVEIIPASTHSNFIPLTNKSGNSSVVGEFQNIGDNNVGLGMSNNERDISIIATRSGNKRRRGHDSQTHAVTTKGCSVSDAVNKELQPDNKFFSHQENFVEVKVEPTGLRISVPPTVKLEHSAAETSLTWSSPSDDEDPNAELDGKKPSPALCGNDDDYDDEDDGDVELRRVEDFGELPTSLHVPSGTPDVGPRQIGAATSTRMFACPYLKFDPKTYGQRRSCRGPSFPTTHRLKEHLDRVHRQKPNCDRCRKIFSTEEDVRQHRRSKEACELAEGVIVEGFDAAQKEKLQSKKRTRSKSEEEKWKDIYLILFPGCLDVPDPFYNPYSDTGVIDPASGRGVVERVLTDSLRNQICDDIEKAIGAPLSRKKRRNVTDIVMKALGQDQTTAKDDTSKATAKINEDGREAVSLGSLNAEPTSSEPIRSAHKAETTESSGVLSDEDQQKLTYQILNEPARPTRVVEETEWPSLELREFNFGEELDRWTGSIEDGMGCDWFRRVDNSGFQMPVNNLVGEQHGGGVMSQSDVDGSFMGVNW